MADEPKPRTGGTKLFWVVAIIGAFLAGGELLLGVMGATSAPQQAAAAGIACALAVIPYVFARAIDELNR